MKKDKKRQAIIIILPYSFKIKNSLALPHIHFANSMENKLILNI